MSIYTHTIYNFQGMTSIFEELSVGIIIKNEVNTFVTKINNITSFHNYIITML